MFPLMLVVPVESVVNFSTFTSLLKVVASDALTVSWRSPVTVLLKVVLALVKVLLGLGKVGSLMRLTASPKV